MKMVIREELGKASGYEALAPTVSTGITATLLTPTSGLFKGKMAKAALLTVETYPIRFRQEGTPTADVGHYVTPGQTITLTGMTNLKNFRCIDTAAGASSVRVTVFHEGG